MQVQQWVQEQPWGAGAKLIVAAATARGLRERQEDALVILPQACVAVFDGHGGTEAALRAASALSAARARDGIEGMVETMRALDAATRSCVSGSTATVVCIDARADAIVVGNLGDSHCMLCSPRATQRLTVAHDPADPRELRRIRQSNGHVLGGRVMGVLNMSRALGDAELQPFGLSAEPSLCRVRNVRASMAGKEAMLVLASDGVWNYMSDSAAAHVVFAAQARGQSPAAELVRAALAVSDDNVSVVTVQIVLG